MSDEKRRKVTIRSLLEKKRLGERITSIGVYDSPMAAIADRIGFDLLINGNAGPMALFGHSDPTTVQFEEQLYMTRAVSRVAKYGMIIGHMPYLSYYGSPEHAVRNAGKMVSIGGADAVKVEGNAGTVPYIEAIIAAGIPVMGHIGMQAQRRAEQSGFGVKGKTAEEALEIVETAQDFVRAGVFAFILEQVPAELGEYLSKSLPVPVISLGAGSNTDGIYHISGDVVGYSAFPLPRNRKGFSDVRPLLEKGLQGYKDAVLNREHPLDEDAFHMNDSEFKRFNSLVQQSK